MNQLYINKFSFFPVLPVFLVCFLVLTTCENPFIDGALQPKKITFDTNGGSEVPDQTVYKGKKIIKPVDPKKGEEDFLGWFTDNNYFTDEWDFSESPESDLTLFAKWTDFFDIVIPDVNINITIPVKGAVPNTTATVPPGSSYTSSAVSWGPGHNPFIGGQQYTAAVTLTAAFNHVFAKSDFSATINSAFTAVVLNNTGSTVTLSYAFPATLDKEVQSVAITSQPSKMNYIHADTLDLTGLSVTLVYTDGTSDANIAPAAFVARGIFTSVLNGSVLEYSGSYNNQRIEISAGGKTAETSANLTIDPRPIPAVSLTFPAPAVGQIPTPSAMVNYSGHFSVDAVTWSPSVGDKFLGSIAYTASVTLTANDNYTFTGGLLTAAINGNDAVVVNNGATATLSHTFPQTSGKYVTSIVITSGPANLNYTHGQTLDLTGLSVTLAYNDETTLVVPLAEFGANNITTVPAAGAQVSRLTHNSNPIMVIYNESASLRTITSVLAVSPKAITITGVTAETRPYDGTAAVALAGGALQGVEANDTVGFTLGNGTMANTGIGDNKQVTTNIALTGSGASNYTLTQLNAADVLVNITPAQITSASVSVAAPAANMESSPAAYYSGHFTASVTWLRNGTVFTGTFLNGNEYTARVTLTADANYIFADDLTASINGNAASTSIDSNAGSTVVLSRLFPTASKAVVSLAINTQPSNINYTHGQALNLAGLAVTLTYNDSSTEVVPLAQFAEKNITTEPANGLELSRTDYNHVPVIVVCNNSAARAYTNQLSITKAAGAAVTSQNPSFVSGNSYTAAAPAVPSTGQSIEYAISASASVALTELTWQTSPAFTIMPYSAVTYYWYARTAENNDYFAGTHSRSVNGITFYSVAFNSDGQQFAPVQIVRSGQLATAPVSNPIKPSFSFGGWLNGSNTWDFAANTVTANIVLNADWRANHVFSIGFDLITDLAPSISTGLSFSRSGALGQDTGITITLPAPPAGQTYANISWTHEGHNLGNGTTLELGNDDIRVNLIGNNKIISLSLFVNGVPFSKNVTFNVVP